MRAALLFARSDIVGGVSVIMRNLCAGLGSYGIETLAITGGNGPYLADLRAHAVPYEIVPSLGAPIRPVRDLRAIKELRSSLRRMNPDLLACHSSKAGVVGRIAAGTIGIPAVYTAHGWSFSEGVSRGSAAVRLVIERTMAATFPSPILNVCEHDRAVALQLGVGSPEQHLVVLNGIPDVDPALHAEPGRNPPHIVMIARFEPQKDPETLVAALAGLTDRAWTAELVGNGESLEACRRRAAALALGDRLAFPGPVDRPDEVLARAQIFVLTTNWEGLPVTILEAMRAGLPTVASDVGGVAEAVDHGGTGFLVPRSDVGAVRDALAKLIDDAELRVRLGTQARKRYESDFTEQRMLAGVAEVYRQVVADYPARRS
jgi:glycosyltransferase involved in cell wall biosynthesis